MNSNKTQLTQKANLYFNINKFKNYIFDTYTALGVGKPKCNKAHVYLTCFCEHMCIKLIQNVQVYVSKDANGLYKISRQALKYSIELNRDLARCLIPMLLMYDETLIYEKKFTISKDIVIDFIEKNFSKDIDFYKDAYDFLAFVLTKSINDVIINTIELLSHSGKRTIGYSTILSAIKLEFKNSEVIRNEFVRKLEEVHLLIDSLKNENNNDDNDNDDEHNGENDENNDDENDDNNNNKDNDKDDEGNKKNNIKKHRKNKTEKDKPSEEN